MESYFNTTNETGKVLDKSIEKAEKQEEIILKLYRKHIFLSPSQVYAYFDESTPITSIRRAITVLTDKGLLKKTEDFVQGGYGKREHIYKLVEKVTLEEMMDGVESELLNRLISFYLESGWHMVNKMDLRDYPESEFEKLVSLGLISIHQGINSPVVNLKNPLKYKSTK